MGMKKNESYEKYFENQSLLPKMEWDKEQNDGKWQDMMEHDWQNERKKKKIYDWKYQFKSENKIFLIWQKKDIMQ